MNKRFMLTLAECSALEAHVWTAPLTQGQLTFGAAIGCGHVFSLLVRLMTVGLDAVRGLAPNPFCALGGAML